MRFTKKLLEMEESAETQVPLGEIRFDLAEWLEFKTFLMNNEEEPADWIKDWHYYVLYDDENDSHLDESHLVKTTCPLSDFNRLLEEFKKANSEYGYTYDDFFDFLREKEFEIKKITPEANIYF